MRPKLIERLQQRPQCMPVVLGPTACGKTHLAVYLAGELGAEVIGADSRQVYRGMDIGSGKDLAEYVYKNRPVPYHLIDVAQAGEQYNVFRYQQDFDGVYERLKRGRRRAVLCGGSGLYLQAALGTKQFVKVPENNVLRSQLDALSLAELGEKLSQYGPQHNSTNTENRSRCLRALEIAEFEKQNPQALERTPPLSYLIGIDAEPQELRKRIALRLDQRLQNGMIEEVQGLLKQGLEPDQLIYYGLEYKYITLYVEGKISTLEQMKQDLFFAICQFAKKQRIWFRAMERKGFFIEWIPMQELVQK